MYNTEIIINGYQADLPTDDLGLSLSYAIASATDFDNSKDPSTRTIKLPATGVNRKIFRFADDPSSVDFKGQKEILDAVVKVGGTVVFIGRANLLDVTRDENGTFYNITIVGNCRQWVEQMKEARLQGIDLGCTHTLNKATVDASETNNFKYLYGLINRGYMGSVVEVESIEDYNGYSRFNFTGTNIVYGLRTNFEFGEIVEGVGFNLSAYNIQQQITEVGNDYLITDCPFTGNAQGKIRQVKGKVVIEDRPLLHSDYNIINCLFADAGYQVESAFLSSTFFRRKFSMFDNFRHSEQWCTDRYVKAAMTNDQVITNVGMQTILFDKDVSDASSSFNTTTHSFVAPSAMHVVMRTKARITQLGTEERTAWVSYCLNGSLYPPTNRPLGQIDLSEDAKALENECEWRLQAGDTVTVKISISLAGNVTISKDETQFEVEVQQTISVGSTVAPGDYLPDIPRIDYIKAIKHLFNLYFITDIYMKKVYIEPRDSFYVRDKIIDLSGKLDISKVITMEELGSDLSKTVNLQYKVDEGDTAIKEWELANAATLGQYRSDIANRFAKNGEQAIENPVFSATLMGTCEFIGLSSPMPKMWGDTAEGNDIPARFDGYSPRTFYYYGIKVNDGLEKWIFEETERTTYPYLYTYGTELGDENSLMFNDMGLLRGLYQRYYYNQFKTVNQSRRLTAFFDLNEIDVSGFQVLSSLVNDFRAMAYVTFMGEGGYYRIEQIQDYNPQKRKSTKVVLVRDVDRLYTLPQPQMYEATFRNNTPVIGQQYANGGTYEFGPVFGTVRSATNGDIVYGNSQLVYGIGAFRYINNWYQIQRGFFFFDTSSIPAGATILAASLFIWKEAGDIMQEIAVYKATQGNILTTYDYDNFSGNVLGESTPGPLGWRRIDFNAEGRAAITKTGYTKLCLRERNYDHQNMAPTQGFTAFKTYFSGAPVGKVNYLTVKWTIL